MSLTPCININALNNAVIRDLLDFNNIKIHCQETNLIALQWHAGQIVSCLWHIFLVSPSHLSNPQPRIWGLSPSTQHQPSNRWQKTEIIWRGLLVTWKSMWCWHQTSLGWLVYKKNILSHNLKHFDISELHVQTCMGVNMSVGKRLLWKTSPHQS